MSKPQFNLEGKCALVCGASGGIGTVTALLMARAGATVFISGTREEKLQTVEEKVRAIGGKCYRLALDLTTEGKPAQLVDAAVQKMGRLDVLVNAMGINRTQKPEDVTAANWDAVMDINLRSLFFVCQAAGRHMIPQKYGRIVNISSQAGTVALPLRSAYCASKGGVNQLTRVLALEWAPHNITVNAVSPTFVETPFVTEMFKDASFKKYVLESIPIGRMASEEEVAYAVLFLVCDFAAIITGHVLLVDGGWTIK